MYMVIFRDLSLLMHCLDPAPYIGNVMTQPVNDDPWIFCKIVSVTRSLTFSPSCRKDEWDEKTKEVWIAWRTRHGPTRLGVVFLFVGVCGAKSRQNKICVTMVYDHMILLACIIWYHVFFSYNRYNVVLYFIPGYKIRIMMFHCYSFNAPMLLYLWYVSNIWWWYIIWYRTISGLQRFERPHRKRPFLCEGILLVAAILRLLICQLNFVHKCGCYMK